MAVDYNDVAFDAMNNATKSNADNLTSNGTDYASARDWLSKVLPNPKELSGQGGIPSWMESANRRAGSDMHEIDDATRYSDFGTEHMSKERLEAWGITPGTEFEGYEGNITGEQILNRNVPSNRLSSSSYHGGGYSPQKDPAVGWYDKFHGEDFAMGQDVLFGDIKEMHSKNPELWKGDGGGYDFSEEQIDKLGEHYKSFLDPKSPGYKKAASVFNWKD